MTGRGGLLGGCVAVGVAAMISITDLYRVGVFDEKGRCTRLRFGATRTALRFMGLRLLIDSGIGIIAYVLAPGMRFRTNMETALTAHGSDGLYGILAPLAAVTILRRQPRAKGSGEQLPKSLREWLFGFRQFTDDRIAEKCYVAVSQWKRRIGVPAILRLKRETVRSHLWEWLDRYSGFSGSTITEVKKTVTALLADDHESVEHIVSTIIETFLALPRSDECISQLVRIGQKDGQPEAFATSRVALSE